MERKSQRWDQIALHRRSKLFLHVQFKPRSSTDQLKLHDSLFSLHLNFYRYLRLFCDLRKEKYLLQI